MRIIYNNIIPTNYFMALNLFGFIFVRNSINKCSDYHKQIIFRHKEIHNKQYKELGYVFFVAWYVLEYLVKLLFCWNFKDAFNSVSFEQEANLYEIDNMYLQNRKHYSWLKYVFKLWD